MKDTKQILLVSIIEFLDFSLLIIMNVSPSTERVNDFLSSLSKLSQERIMQDQEIKRGLDRDIQSLKGTINQTTQVLDISILSNRVPPMKPKKPTAFVKAQDTIKSEYDDGPPLPRRRFDEENPPVLPVRRDIKEKPWKPIKPLKQTVIYSDMELQENLDNKKYKSFNNLKQSIEKGEHSRPNKPAKANWLSLDNHISNTFNQASSYKSAEVTKEPSKSLKADFHRKEDVIVADQEVNQIDESAKLVKIKPLVPKKPSSSNVNDIKIVTTKPRYEEFKKKDNELLLAQISKLKPAKAPPPKPAKEFGKYNKQDTQELHEKLAILSPIKPKQVVEPFSLKNNELVTGQLNKIKKKPEDPNEPEIKPKAITDETPEVGQLKVNEINFKSQLSLIIKTNSNPSLSNQTPILNLKRYGTDPTGVNSTKTETKLSHPNKSRSKGPKRRLPKTLKTEQKHEKETINIPNKVPPALKPKPKNVGNLKSTIQFQGEVFI